MIDKEKQFKLKGRNKTDHNTIIKEIQKDTAKVKKENEFSWKVNSKTNWHNWKLRLGTINI